MAVNWASLKDHLVSAAAAAALLGGGTAVITTKIDVAVHDQRLDNLEELNKNVEGLRQDLSHTREDLLRYKLEKEHEQSK
jgi:uncharacterized protein (DUF342 family)